MRPAAPTSRLSLRVLRGAAAVVVAVGYLAALNATAIGHGWRLAPHLALEHGPAVAAPGVLEDADLEGGPGVVLTTLRDVHRHGGHAHTHGPAHADLEDASPSRTHTHSAPLSRTRRDLEGDLHEHDGVLHSHRAPPPEPDVVVTLTLDKHRPAQGAAVPTPSARPSLGALEVGEAFATRGTDVETPPPVARG